MFSHLNPESEPTLITHEQHPMGTDCTVAPTIEDVIAGIGMKADQIPSDAMPHSL